MFVLFAFVHCFSYAPAINFPSPAPFPLRFSFKFKIGSDFCSNRKAFDCATKVRFKLLPGRNFHIKFTVNDSQLDGLGVSDATHGRIFDFPAKEFEKFSQVFES